MRSAIATANLIDHATELMRVILVSKWRMGDGLDLAQIQRIVLMGVGSLSTHNITRCRRRVSTRKCEGFCWVFVKISVSLFESEA